MSPEVKDRLQMVMNLVKVSFHWGYIPVVLYFGFRKGPDPGSAPFSLGSILW